MFLTSKELCKFWQNNHTKPANGNIYTFSGMCSGQVASSLEVPFNAQSTTKVIRPWRITQIFESQEGSQDSLLVKRRTRDREVASLNLSRGGGRMFFSRVNFVCWLLLGVRSTTVLPQRHVKDPGHSAKSAGGRLHLNAHKPLIKRNQSGLTTR